ncbi:MAG: FAD-binding protein [Gammaproteobacteria bacterium]|jgi:FAD-linked oxidoreductase|nr:FAD-binding protein [Gammaproteobacteria bacterium]MBT4494960.1 FAD-binding protein [Gammaproteobacteria bacterium]MBT7370684.1 FAD-binding protein [Gammaproteobacteria bacterium]
MITRRRLLASSLLTIPGMALSSEAASGFPWRNWSGHLVANPAGRFAPGSEDELVNWLCKTSGQVRPVGAGHSFSPLVPTNGHLVITDRLSGIVSHDPDTLQAEIYAGTRLGNAGAPLWQLGQAMPNLPDIDRQTIAGALATSTHGTGRGLKSLSGYVTGMRLVTPGGDVLDLDKNHEYLPAAAVSLGAFGFVTRARFQNREIFNLRTRTWTEKTASILDRFDDLCDDWQHFEMMPLLHSDYSLVIAHQEADEDPMPVEEEDDGGEFLQLIESTPVLLRGALINSLAGDIEPTETIQPSWQALTNLRFDRFNEMEYSVPVESGPECLAEILQLIKDNNVDVVMPLEYRIIDADDTWLSMFSGGPRVSISVHRLAHENFESLFNLVEPVFWKYEGRPHWGKVHSLGYSELRQLYPRLDDFVELQRELDPQGRMLNSHLRKLLRPMSS